MARSSSLEELELSGEEVARLAEAFRDERFRSLFAEYVAELNDPGQRAVYETEVVALERQRGVEARFLHPAPGWVLRTSQAGSRRCYVNICSHPLVGRPQARPGPRGSAWSLPHCLAPGREELRRRGRRLLLYDVLFHPDALRLAARSTRFRQLVDDTALEALETHFQAGLDRANAVQLRGTKYKGAPQATLLRTPLPGGAPPPEDGEEASPLPPFPTPYAYPPPEPEVRPPPPPAPPAAAAATTPRWTLRQRCYVDLQDYRCSRDSAPSPVPRELVVSVELPLLSSAAQAQLEIRGQELQLDSQRPAAAYRLRLPLPYPVDEGRGRATFNKATRQLVVTLPVLPKPGPALEPQQQSRVADAAAAATPAEDHVEPPAEPSQESFPPDSVVEAPDRDGHSLPLERDPTSLPLSGAHVRRSSGDSPGLPLGALPAGATVPCAAGCGLSPPTCHDAPGLEAPTGPPSNREDEEDLAVRRREDSGLAPAGSVGSRAELPPLPSASHSAPPAARAPLGPSVDPAQCRRSIATGSVSPERPRDDASIAAAAAAAAAAQLCHGDVDRVAAGPTLTRRQDSSFTDPDDHQFPPCPGGGSSSSCSRLVPPPGSNTSSHVELCVPAVCPENQTPDPLPLSETGLSSDAGGPVVSASSSSSSCPCSVIMPAASPTPLLCPPFRCTQDEESLTLLLQVPGIVPQSLKGEVGTHHYRVGFSSKETAASYSLLLQFPPENKLTPPETEINVSLNNAVIGLAKSLETTRLWSKLYFGLKGEDLKERWFFTEDNVDGFLDSLATASCSKQSTVEGQPLVEVLDVSEGKSQIRVKQGEEQPSFEPGGAEETVRPRRTGSGPESGCELPTKADHRETRGGAGGEPGHCSAPLNPTGPNCFIPGKSLISRPNHESELACTTSKEATSTTPGALAKTGEGKEGPSQLAEKQGGPQSRPAPPVLKETDLRDGSVQLLCQHTTHCTVTFQNPLLYELD